MKPLLILGLQGFPHKYIQSCCHFLLPSPPPLLFSAFIPFLIAITPYKYCI